MKTMRRLRTKFIAMLIILTMSFSIVQPMLEVYAAPSTPVLDYDTITNGIGNRLIAIDQSRAANFGQAGYKNEDYGYFLLDKKATYHMQGSGDPTPFDRFPAEVVTVIPAPGQTQKTYTEGTHYKFTDTGTQIEFYPLPALWDEMVRDDDNVDAVDAVTFRFRWYFKGEPVVGQDVYHEKIADVTFYRPTYRFSNIEILDGGGNVVGNRKNPVAENHYFNTENRTIKVRVTLEAFDTARSAELAQDFNSGDVALFKGNVSDYSAGNELHSQPQIERSGNTVTYIFDFQGRDVSSEDQGITFCLNGNLNNMTITSSGVDWGFRDNKAAYFSNCKVDTKLPVFVISDLESGTSTVWAKVHKLRINPSESLAGNTVEYYLVPQELPLADYMGNSSGGAKTRQVFPAGTDATLNLKLDGKYEGKYTLRIEGTDLAGNKSYNEVPVWLDNMAPRASVAELPHEQAGDGSKSFDYKFDIEDQSGKGRVYYCFVKDGAEVPAKGGSQWLFVELNGTTTTAVCKVAAGENFIGRLYYYTDDDFGNDSYQESGAYYSQEIRIYNDLVTTQPVIQDASKGRSSYDISYDGEGRETLQYRWIDENIIKTGFVQAAFTEYTGAQDIGAAVHIGDDGKSYTFDGTYKLVYKITNTTSGNYVQGEYTFVFDNSVPSIELPVWTNGTKIRDTQQALIRISDKGAISEASYRIVDIYNTPIDGIQEIPIVIENDGSVNTLVSISLPEGIGSGIYGIRIKATDKNGNYKETGYNYADKTPAAADDGRQAAYYASPAMRLAIRKDKPELILNKVSDGYGAPLEFYNGAYRVGESDYRINLEARELMRNIGEFSYITYLKYQTSTDGVSWSDWKDTGVGGMYTDPATDISMQGLDIINPYPLNAGTNSIYIRTACYNFDQSAGDKQEELERTPQGKNISTPVIVNIILDQAPAQYTVSYESTQRTNKNVTAALIIDNTSGKTYQTGSGTDYVTISEISGNTEYRLTISQNVDTTIWIKNNLGITTYVPVKVDWIDKEGPAAELISSNTVNAGERTDAELKLTIKDTKPGTTELALIDYAHYFSNPAEDDFTRFNDLVSQGKIKVAMVAAQVNQYGERDETYTLTFRGMSGRYFLGYRGSDSIENKRLAAVDSDIKLTDAQIKPPEVAFEPLITKSQTVATVSFNVPVAVLPDSLTVGADAENLELAAEYA
ncbi:MAG: hypothetical protein VB106_08180, partial [Clostridiaceae bacterium]|nr:hypothetical protein [Clostridiaceae bacterium]